MTAVETERPAINAAEIANIFNVVAPEKDKIFDRTNRNGTCNRA